MNTIVTYKSNYGSSKQYAIWISEALNCKAVEIKHISSSKLLSYDTIIHVGGLYASGISGFNQLKKHLSSFRDRRLLLCMVGMTDPGEMEKYEEVYHKNVPEEYRKQIKYFALRGNQLFSEMSLVHRTMMKMPKSQIKKIPVAQRTKQDILFLEAFGKDVRFVTQEQILPVIEYINQPT